MKFPANSESRQTISRYELILTLLGVWPFLKKGMLQMTHAGLVLFSQIQVLIPQYIDLLFGCKNLDDITENLTCTAVINLVIIKLLTMLSHRESMAACVTSVMKDWGRIQDEKYRGIMKSHRRLGKTVLIGLSMAMYSTWVMYIILAIAITSSTECLPSNVTTPCKIFPLRSSYIVNTDWSPLYEMIFIMQIPVGTISCTVNYGVDGFLFFLVMHLCGQLEILKIDFREVASAQTSAEQFRKRIVGLTKRHYELITFSEHLEDTFNMMILGQLLVSSVMICILGFQLILSLEAGNLLKAGGNAVYMSAMLMQLFLYSYAGDYLQNQSLGLSFAAYESSWQELPPAAALDLLFVMIRAGIPLRITAGKFCTMTLESFKVIVKTSGSYLSVLRVMVK